MQTVVAILEKKVIVCIDELDKLSSPEEVRSVLREIKGGLYIKGCYYIISVSADSIESFEARLSSERNIVESTFDEIVDVAPMPVAVCAQLVKRRLVGTETSRVWPILRDDALVTCAVLAGGIPREVIRNVREVLMSAALGHPIDSEDAWTALFRRKVCALHAAILGQAQIEELRAELLRELERLKDIGGRKNIAAALEATRSRTINLRSRLASISNDDDKESRTALANWVRAWLELQIYLMAFLIQGQDETAVEKDLVAEKLRAAYTLLPYNGALCEQKLAELSFIAPDAVITLVSGV